MLFAMSAVLIGVIGIFYVRRRSSRKKQSLASASLADAARAEQVVRRREDDAAEAIRIVRRQPREESRDHSCGGRGAVPAKRRIHPTLGKKMSPVR